MSDPTINNSIIITANEQYVSYNRSVLGSYNSFTVISKFKFDSSFSYGNATICSVFGNTVAGQEFSLGLTDRYLSLLFVNSTNTYYSLIGNSMLTPDTEYVVAVTYDSVTPAVTIFLDNAPILVTAFGSLTTQIQQGSANFMIGRRDSYLSNFLGTIYNVKFYNIVLSLQEIIDYDSPAYNAGLVFFVGGDATRDGTGRLTNIEYVDMPQARREELRRTILRHKPMHSWGALLVNYS